MNLLSLIETEGYGIADAMYYIREEGTGLAGMELIDGMEKVGKMVDQFQDSKCLNLTVFRGNNKPGSGINIPAVEKQIPIAEIGEPVVYSVDDDGVLFPSQAGTKDSEMLYMFTQQSNNNQKGKHVCEEGYVSDQEEGEYSEEDYEEVIRREEVELNQKLIDMKRRRADPLLHCEGDTEPEELFDNCDDSDGDSDCFFAAEPEPVPEPVKRKKIPVRKGPTDRAHCSQASSRAPDFYPSSDDGTDGDLCADDDDGSEQLRWVLPSGRKSRAKKRKPMNWYDERRLQPEEQLCLQMCFRDVYQFREALQTLHIAQLRNFEYHRNCKDRVIAKCSEEGCPFYMVGSEIKGEKTFCLRKLNMEHTCPTSGEGCRVSGKWVAKLAEKSLRIDPRTGIEAVIDTTKEKFGVDVPKMMAYRAKRKALETVLGDHIKQYRRIRDYLQTVMDTNTGSRCLVTTVNLKEHPTTNPRFHGLFLCLGASVEGFLKGCRPLICIDGCHKD